MSLREPRKITAQAAARIAAGFIRRSSPTTIMGVADGLNWSPSKAKTALSAARELGLVAKVGKTERAQFIFAAVQTTDWPQQEQV